MGNSRFGLDIRWEDFILEFINSVGVIKTSVDFRLIFSEYYETKYGIYDHINSGNVRPLASVAKHRKYDTKENSELEVFMKLFLVKNIHARMGLNFNEFMRLPKHVMRSMIDVINFHDTKKSAGLEDLEKELNEAVEEIKTR